MVYPCLPDVFLATFVNPVIFLIPGIAFALVWYFQAFRSDIEYEYTYYDGEFRFAQIKAKSRRKAIGSVQMDDVLGFAPRGDRSVYNYENGNEIKKIDYTSGQKDVPYYDIVIKSPDENVLIKAELDDRFLTEVEKKYRSKVKRERSNYSSPSKWYILDFVLPASYPVEYPLLPFNSLRHLGQRVPKVTGAPHRWQ